MSAIKAITMPKFGLAMTEGKVASWAVAEGAEVRVGEDLADIETTKITNAYESPVKGVFRRKVAAEQVELPVGALIAVVADRDTPDAEIDSFIEAFQAEFSKEQEAGETAKAPEPATIEVGGRRIRYLAVGEHEGTPVIFIHGFGGDLNNWLFTQPVIAESHKTIAIDLPGHGASSKDAPANVAEFAKIVAETLGALDLKKVHLVGHSFGGAIATQVALTHPHLVASLTLVSPAGLTDTIDTDYIQGFISADRRKTLEPIIQKLFNNKSLVSRDMLDDLIKYKRLDGTAAALTSIANENFSDGKQKSVWRARASEISVPVQIIWGADDQIISPPQTVDLPANFRLGLVSGSGHMPHMEGAAEVNRIISDFLSRAG